MAGSIGSLALKLAVNPAGLVSGLSSAMSRISGFAGSVGSTISSAFSGLGTFGLGVQGISTAFGLLEGAIGTPLKLAAELEQTQVAFSTMLGSADKGAKLVADLQAMSAATPFETADLARASKSLLAFGVPLEKLLPTMQVLGDVSAGTGKDIGELSVIFGQIRGAGRLMGQDLLQLVNAGVPIIEELAKHFGKPASAIRDMVEKGKVSFNDVAQALTNLTGQGGRFEGMMDRQSQTVAGKWSTLKDNFNLALTEIGKVLIEAFDVKGVVDQLGTMTEWIKTNIRSVLMPVLSQISQVFAGIWSVVSAAWQQFGAPMFEQLKGAIGGVGEQLPNMRELTINALQAIVQGVNYVVNAFKIAGGAVMEYFIGPLLKGFGFAVQAIEGIIQAGQKVGLFEDVNTEGLEKLREGLKAAGDAVSGAGADLLETELTDGLGAVNEFFDGMKNQLVATAGELFDGLAYSVEEATVNILDPNNTGKLKGQDIKLSGALARGSKEAESVVSRFEAAGLTERDRQTKLQQETVRKLEEIKRVLTEGQTVVAGF